MSFSRTSDRSTSTRQFTPVTGTPGWAVVAAWLTVASVVPSSIWRVSVGLGVPLGWSQAHLDLERMPGYGTVYVIWLSLASIAAAALTLGLVYRWGERVPSGVPLLGGRRVPVWPVAAAAVIGGVLVLGLVVLSILSWPTVSGFDGRLTSGWALLMAGCYVPAALWAPLLFAVTYAYVRRRAQSGR